LTLHWRMCCTDLGLGNRHIEVITHRSCEHSSWCCS